MADPLKRLLAAGTPRPSQWVRFTKATRAVDVDGGRWEVSPGCEMELDPQEARRAVAYGDAVAIQNPNK